MTSLALVVLTLALVCSIPGTTSEQTADRASEHAMHIQKSKDTSSKMRIWTNKGNDIVNKDIAYKNNNYRDNFIARTQIEDITNRETKHENSINKKDRTAIEQDIEYVRFVNRSSEIRKDENYSFYKDKNIKPRNDYKRYYKTQYKNTENSINTSLSYETFNKKSKHFNPILNYIKSMTKSVEHLNRVKRDEPQDVKCKEFQRINDKISHPYNSSITSHKNYYNAIECTFLLTAASNEVIMLTFIDHFHIEYHPDCAYDYLEIRDGEYGFSRSLGKFCGDKFPQPIYSTGPVMWLKFKSDETIEYEGFSIKVKNTQNAQSYKNPDSCKTLKNGPAGVVSSAEVDPNCLKESEGHALDVIWEIEVEEGHAIYLNFTNFELTKPNECEENLVQVFGEVCEEEKQLAHYCGSAANAVTTKSESKTVVNENKMTVRMYFSEKIRNKTYKVIANFTAFRTLDPNKEEECDSETEFDCEDNTCIDKSLFCDNYANCRLKADEDVDKCHGVKESIFQQDHIIVIMVIFSIIISGMSFIFLYKCIKKLYEDHKAIKEHIRQSTEDRLDTLMSGSLILDPKGLREPRASLERENHTNELFKQQRSISQHKGLPQQTSIDSDFRETRLDIEDDPWHRDVESIPEQQDAKAERNGRTRRSDISRREESLRSRKESVEEKKEIRDAAVGAPDTKESGCQTRESLFQTETAPSSDGSNSASQSRGFSTFGYSGATLVRPSPPPAPAPMISSTQIELLRQLPSLETTHKSQKKLTDRRPMSAETTRSAPDVIIVSKPIR